MTGTEIALIISSCGTLVTAFAAFTGVMIGARNGRAIAAVHSSTNGKMEELLQLTAKSSKAEGKEEQRMQRPETSHSLPDMELPPAGAEKSEPKSGDK